jgi:hypothetical protein
MYSTAPFAGAKFREVLHRPLPRHAFLILQYIQGRADAAGDIDWLIQTDSITVRAHQHAVTGQKGPTGRMNRTITPSVDPEAD